MRDYPKRLYRSGKGYTVNNLDEEQEFLTSPEKKNIDTEELPDEVSPVQTQIREEEKRGPGRPRKI